MPLLLAHGLEQATPHGAFRVMQEGARHELRLRASSDWKPLHHFTPDALARADFKMASWFVSTRPKPPWHLVLPVPAELIWARLPERFMPAWP